jgi:hypothetical protein
MAWICGKCENEKQGKNPSIPEHHRSCRQRQSPPPNIDFEHDPFVFYVSKGMVVKYYPPKNKRNGKGVTWA